MMSAGWKFIKHLKNGRKLLTAAAVGVTGTVTSMSKTRRKVDGKDEIVILSKEENAVPSTAKIVMKDIGENRDPILPNGDLNWACACVEKDVAGPCNIQFRKLRAFMHTHDIRADFLHFDENLQGQFDKLFEDFIICTMDYPVYYAEHMLDEEKEEQRIMEEKIRQLEEKKRQEKEANTRLFGKDKVVFLTKEENSVPSFVDIPKVQVEENRDPVLPNGDINWACTCIEKDVIGPCNVEFREFRKLVAKNRNRKDDEEMSEEAKMTITDFLMCIRSHPVYYKSIFSKDSDDDDDDVNGEPNEKPEAR